MPELGDLLREDLLALLVAWEEERAVVDAAKDARIDALLVTVGELTAQVQALVLRLSKDSSTSSKPPSSDGPGRRPRGDRNLSFGALRDRCDRVDAEVLSLPWAGSMSLLSVTSLFAHHFPSSYQSILDACIWTHYDGWHDRVGTGVLR
ncbi:MAG: family transposase [Actinomycetota bacterium]|nr:family transposase [Actinomycetota bacterium]